MTPKEKSEGVPIKYEKPPVHVNGSGVHSVNPADILRSRLGREQIEKAAEFSRHNIPPGAPR